MSSVQAGFGRKRQLMTDTLGRIVFVVVCVASIADSDGASSMFHETEERFPRLHSVLGITATRAG